MLILKPKTGSIFLATGFLFFSFCQGNCIKDKINSHICLMLSVYKSFQQTVKYGHKETICYKI